jgi:hypothetical protein
VTLLNLFGMGGAGVMQFVSGPVQASLATTRPPVEAYGALFGMIGICVLIGCAIYAFSRDSAS